MDAFEPIINLLVLLTALSVAAERLTNFFKLRNPNLRERPKDGPDAARDAAARDYAITGRTLVAGIVIALVVKANFFEILAHLEDPWTTLGWVAVDGGNWVRAAASSNLGTALYAVFGSVLTGIALGFGSRFWHDVLETMTAIKEAKRG